MFLDAALEASVTYAAKLEDDLKENAYRALEQLIQGFIEPSANGLTAADIAQDFYEEANRDGLPVRLLAFADGELAGTITLREQATWTLPEYQPGLGGLLVAEQYRGRGIGTELVKAGMNLAREQGYQTVYATTVKARGILESLGWQLVREVAHDDEQLGSIAANLKTCPT